MRNSILVAAIALASGACAPQSAELLSGNYTAFISESTSLTLGREAIDLDGYDTHYQIDCRSFADEETAMALRLPDRLPICGPGDDGDEDVFLPNFDGANEGDFPEPDVIDYDDDGDQIIDFFDCDDQDPAVDDSGCEPGGGDGFWPPFQESWVGTDGWEIVSEDLDPWRGEGVVTHEGDLLVSFHHRIPGNQDFWFQFALDRFFQPTVCTEDDNGEVIRAALDGDWIDEWSKDLERIADLQGDDEAFAPFKHLEPYLDGRMYYLNARSFQINPEENDDRWNMPEQWASGAAQGKFSEELLAHRPQLFGEPEIYDLFESLGADEGAFGGLGGILSDLLWYCEMVAGTDPSVEANQCMADLQEQIDRVVSQSRTEMDFVLKPDRGLDDESDSTELIYNFSNMRHLNTWRAVDGAPSGFDGWGEMHYSYVVFSKDSDLRIGGSASGAFTLFLQGQDSNTRIMLQGEFNIPKIKKDHWTPGDLRAEKRAEAIEDDPTLFYCSN